jgi:hypothetical protein
MTQKSYLGRAAEGLLYAAVVVGVVQALGADYAFFAGLDTRLRTAAVVAGFAVDFVFTAEFVARAAVSGGRGGFFAYLLREGGLVDLLVSVPLLALVSGPEAWAAVFPGKTGAVAGFALALGGLRLPGAIDAGRVVRNLLPARTMKVSRAFKFSGGIRRRAPLTPLLVGRSFSHSAAAVVLALVGFVFVNARVSFPRAEAFTRLLAQAAILVALVLSVTSLRSFFRRHLTLVLGPVLRGFRSAEYSTPLRIDEKWADLETYRIADQYNRKWLPLKRKILEAKRGRKAADE